MHLSLGRIGSNLRRKAVLARVLAVGWSFALLLTLTPCCEVWATATPVDRPAAQGHADAHAHGEADVPHGSHGDIDDGPCAPWLNVSQNALDSVPALLPATPSPEGTVVLWVHAVVQSSMERRPDAPRSVHAPPPVPRPLYLRFVRLLD
jgi:hypothetical protein